ncbi:MAG: elongation factor G [Candidatus Eisenbacteria bacterium]
MSEKKTPIQKLRNIGIIAHIDAGKTTTSERILYYAGVSHSLGEVDAGSTQMDWMDQERERGITIVSAATRLEWNTHPINLIDTPGHVDFTAEVERALRVLDGAVVVLCAVGGVEPQSEMVWHQATRYCVPRVIFINKMDRLGADFEAVLEDIRQKLGVTPVVTNFPVGTESDFEGVVDVIRGDYLVWKNETLGAEYDRVAIPAGEQERYESYRTALLEAVANEDEALLEKFINGEEITPEEITATLRAATLHRRLFPVLSGASLRNRGIQPLLDAVVDYLPAPTDMPAPVGIDTKTGDRIVRQPKNNEPLLGLVFKTQTQKERGRICYVRIYSGQITEGMTVEIPRLGANERVARLFRMHADKRKNLKDAGAGDIVALTGLKLAATGDTVCVGEPILLEGIEFPQPVVSSALEASTSADEEKLQIALTKLSDDDPTFRVKIDENTGQTLISGMGELHLEILAQRLIREFGLKIRVGRPQVTYRETITETVEATADYDRFTGGTENFAQVSLVVRPLDRGAGITFESKVPEGGLPANMIAIVERAIREATESGIQYGYPIVDVGVTLLGGKFEETRSTELAFRNAAIAAFRDGCRKAGPQLLEPIMSLEIVTPKEFVGGVMSGLGQRRGRVTANEPRGQVQVLEAEAPLSQMFGYATDLRSASQGRATYSMIFSHFDTAVMNDQFVG